jgi:hypothetical protein
MHRHRHIQQTGDRGFCFYLQAIDATERLPPAPSFASHNNAQRTTRNANIGTRQPQGRCLRWARANLLRSEEKPTFASAPQ